MTRSQATATGWGRNHVASTRLFAVANNIPTQKAILDSTTNLSQKHRMDAILLHHALYCSLMHDLHDCAELRGRIQLQSELRDIQVHDSIACLSFNRNHGMSFMLCVEPQSKKPLETQPS